MDRAAARAAALARIRANIERAGHHVYRIPPGTTPGWSYTIGLGPSRGHELLLAGGLAWTPADAQRALAALAEGETAAGAEVEVPGLGRIGLREVHPSWSRPLLLGAHDYYQREDSPALQLVPPAAARTLDVPDASQPWDLARAPLWRWIDEEPPRPELFRWRAVTNLAALQGAPITEAARWEEGEWECFAGAGPEVPPEDVRVVPLGLLLATDSSLAPLAELPLEGALIREEGQPWEPWGSRAD